MANLANATGPKTPPPDGNPTCSSEIKSTPNAVGTAVVSENMHTLGTNVKDISPWVKRDVQDYTPCEVDAMLQELVYRCRHEPDSNSEFETDFESESISEEEKKTLLEEALEDVLHLCDETMKETMKKHFSEFINCPTEPPSYKPFVRAVNYALSRLAQLDARGIIPSRIAEAQGEGGIIFHNNDHSIKQKHQGVESTRKPDVVVVSYQSARGVLKDGTNPTKSKLYSDIACKKPHGNFQWPDILSTFEFKRAANHKMKHPNYDNVTIVDAPTPQYMGYGKGRGDNVQPTGSTPVTDAGPSQRAPNEPKRYELRSSTGANKRTSDNSDQPTSNKRLKGNNENPNNEKSKITDPMAQNGMYAAEMFAADVARQHVISCLVNNDILYIWYFDRQNAIQCSGFNFIHDLPRFLVLLLIMQRLPYAQWGHNQLFEPAPGVLGKVAVEDEKLGTVDLRLHLDSPERVTHYGLRGRATNVFPVTSKRLSQEARKLPSLNKTDELVAKLYWPEQSRQSEAEILEEVHKIAAGKAEVKDHIPEVIWSHKFEGTSTAKIRKALGIDDAQGGNRVLYIIVFRKLRPITELSGDEFLRAWWHAVVCHRVLWENGVRHRDISPSNLMFYLDSDGRVIGVLNDYDLSSLKIVPTGRERTGTVPFMAIDLLSDAAVAGKVEHCYRHDAESFIWVLTWVSLRYEDGKLRSIGRPFDNWLTTDANGCREKKTAFLFDVQRPERVDVIPSSSHQSNWQMALYCLRVLLQQEATSHLMDDKNVFHNWLYSQAPPWLLEQYPVHV